MAAKDRREVCTYGQAAKSHYDGIIAFGVFSESESGESADAELRHRVY